jgi:hypothetical protein
MIRKELIAFSELKFVKLYLKNKDKAIYYLKKRIEKKEYINWKNISTLSFINLSESFLITFSDEIFWNHLSVYQNFSLETLIKFKDKINQECLLERNTLVPKEIKEKFINFENLLK